MLGDGFFPLASHTTPPPEEALLALLVPVIFQKIALPQGFRVCGSPGGNFQRGWEVAVSLA
jgi:hypothetical protein